MEILPVDLLTWFGNFLSIYSENMFVNIGYSHLLYVLCGASEGLFLLYVCVPVRVTV